MSNINKNCSQMFIRLPLKWVRALFMNESMNTEANIVDIGSILPSILPLDCQSFRIPSQTEKYLTLVGHLYYIVA